MQAAAQPLVSIIVPSYNQGRFIRRTLESIFTQDYQPLQVIVVDGASTDETVDVLRSFDGTPGFEWVSEPDSGVVEAVNKGFARARGVIGGIQSSDDFYLPGAIGAGVLMLMASLVTEGTHVGMVSAVWVVIGKDPGTPTEEK